MQRKLLPCPSCSRHIVLGTAKCPFCDGALPQMNRRALGALAAAMGLAVAGCPARPAAKYGMPPQPAPVDKVPPPPDEDPPQPAPDPETTGKPPQPPPPDEEPPPDKPLYGMPPEPESENRGG